ncbi:MAG: uncharacterized protein JG777_1422 [Clostridia bacterium]|jgi:uncharacterized protein (DUF362 family)|nr:uncharacterized protein [Clostridia bacterium]
MMNKNQIYVIYGNTPKTMIKEILTKARIEEEIDKSALIGIKPNLVVAKPSTSGATTTPDLVAGVIEYLQSKGYQNIIILEGSWVGDRTFRAFSVCGYEQLSKLYNVPLVDLQRDKYTEYDAGGVRINVCNKAMEVDYLINMPVLKGHCQTSMTCALKNMKGCIPDSEKRKFHTMGLHKPIAYLNRVVKSNLIIVDGLMGDLTFEEGGTPVQMNRVFVGKDPVLIDAYAAELMGFNLNEIPYIQMAERIGVGSADVSKAEIIELNKDCDVRKITRSHKVERLSKYIEEKDACSACYGSLIHALERLDERGLLARLRGKICIGQGYKGQQGEGIGIGVCTKGFSKGIPGCPPKAKDIVEFIEKNI